MKWSSSVFFDLQNENRVRSWPEAQPRAFLASIAAAAPAPRVPARPAATSAPIYDPPPALGLAVLLVSLLPRYRQMTPPGHTSPAPPKAAVGGRRGPARTLPVAGGGHGGAGSRNPGQNLAGLAVPAGTFSLATKPARLQIPLLYSTALTKSGDRERFVTIASNAVAQNTIIFHINGLRPFERGILRVTLTTMRLLMSQSTIYTFRCHGQVGKPRAMFSLL